MLLFVDDFDRLDSDSLGSEWMEAESVSTKFGVRSGRAFLDVGTHTTRSPQGNIDFAHAVTRSTFDPRGLDLQVIVRHVGNHHPTVTTLVSLGIASVSDSDTDVATFQIIGNVEGFDARLRLPNGETTENSFIGSDTSDHVLRLVINSGGTNVVATFDGEILLERTLPIDALPDEVTVKIGNPFADDHTGFGPGRKSNVEFDELRVSGQSPD
jgi:hypothetical protein